ncbi:MAG: TIGR03087 family PEP-CTERM/XrtA system glycosyltransferase [Novosphingobium sp.]|nr:TIGR03087 family PEP-CTERM/XrtA system glycosyltransferase [Novosphingobium sp.]
MREILFLSHRIPFPPDRGDKIRSHHILKRLTRIAPVHVATFAEDDFDSAEEAELAAVASSYVLVRRTKPLALAGVQALVAGKPVSLSAFWNNTFADYVAEVLETRPISTIYVFSGQMGQYVPDTFKGRVVADFVDVDSAKFEAYSHKHSGVMSWIDAREARLLRAEEARFAARADVSLLITRSEADLFRSRLPESLKAHTKVEVLANGIDSVAFDPATVAPETRLLDCAEPRLIFTGQMDYSPNIEAVKRTIDRIMPLVRRELPEATFHVVGRNPVQELMDRDGRNGTRVWGRVDDIRTWLKAADMAIVPLEIGRGVQNKVLEAMAMGLPVVLTPAAAEGIDAQDGVHYRVAASDEDLARAVISAMTDLRRSRIQGQAARRFVTETVSWQSALSRLPELIGQPPRAVRDAA